MFRCVCCMIVVLGLVLLSGVVPAQDKAQDWKKDWGAFIDVLSPMFKRAAPTSELKEKFEGHQVTWTGQIAELSFKPKSNAGSVEDAGQDRHTFEWCEGGGQ